MGVHCVEIRRHWWAAQDIFFITCGAKTLFDKCPEVSLSESCENEQTTGRRPEIGARQSDNQRQILCDLRAAGGFAGGALVR